MRWKETCAMEEREALAHAWWSGRFTIGALAGAQRASHPPSTAITVPCT